MATVACPGCGLPRAESELGAKPCPVCASTPTPVTTGTVAPRRAKPAQPDPTDGMPADASELGAAPAARASHRGAWLPLGAAMFFFGTLVGVAGVLGFQAIDGAKPKPDETEVAAKPDETPTPVKAPEPRGPEVAPLPHEPGAKPIEVEPEPEPDPKPLQPPPPPGRITIIDFGPNPPDVCSVPFPMKKGEHVILKSTGKVKTLKVPALDAGAILDASGLEAATVTIGGKIDGHSTLKVNAPNGVVHIVGKVDGKSVVEINAPGGEVKFMYATTGAKEGSKIDGGSKVTVTGRMVEFKGDISGTDTKVSVVLTRNAWLKVASVSGKATVEYQSQAAGWSAPDVTVGAVAPTATFRKAP